MTNPAYCLIAPMYIQDMVGTDDMAMGSWNRVAERSRELTWLCSASVFHKVDGWLSAMACVLPAPAYLFLSKPLFSLLWPAYEGYVVVNLDPYSDHVFYQHLSFDHAQMASRPLFFGQNLECVRDLISDAKKERPVYTDWYYLCDRAIRSFPHKEQRDSVLRFVDGIKHLVSVPTSVEAHEGRLEVTWDFASMTMMQWNVRLVSSVKRAPGDVSLSRTTMHRAIEAMRNLFLISSGTTGKERYRLLDAGVNREVLPGDQSDAMFWPSETSTRPSVVDGVEVQEHFPWRLTKEEQAALPKWVKEHTKRADPSCRVCGGSGVVYGMSTTPEEMRCSGASPMAYCECMAVKPAPAPKPVGIVEDIKDDQAIILMTPDADKMPAIGACPLCDGSAYYRDGAGDVVTCECLDGELAPGVDTSASPPTPYGWSRGSTVPVVDPQHASAIVALAGVFARVTRDHKVTARCNGTQSWYACTIDTITYSGGTMSQLESSIRTGMLGEAKACELCLEDMIMRASILRDRLGAEATAQATTAEATAHRRRSRELQMALKALRGGQP